MNNNYESKHSFNVELPKKRKKLNTSRIRVTKKNSPNTNNCWRSDNARQLINPLDLKKYTLPGERPLVSSMLKKDELVLPYRLFLKQQEHEKFKKQFDIKIQEKYKIVSVDLKKRLHLKDVPNDVKAIKDLDENFFDIVSSHQITRIGSVFKTAKSLINARLRLNIEISLKKDCLLRIEMDQRKELKIYKNSERHCLEQLRLFDTFISEDYKKSIFDLEKWDKLQLRLKDQIHELEALATQSFTSMSRLISLEYKYSIKQMYGRFLYYLSPPTWRAKHRDFAKSVEIEAEGFDYGMSNEGDTFNTLFEKLKKDVCNNPVKPVLYFNHPKGLIDVFIGIEKQQLNHFSYVSHEGPYIHHLRQCLKSLRKKISLDTAFEQSMIKGIQSEIQFYEENCKILQAKFFRVLNGLFYESVGAPEVVKLNHHLDFCYQKVFGETLLNADILSLAKRLENFYFDHVYKLEAIHGEEVRRAVKENFRLEATKSKQAVVAQNELRLFYRLEKELRGAFAPIANKECPPPLVSAARSRNKTRVRQIPKPTNVKLRRLTETEEEYLKLFTDWTENEDPSKYLHSFSIDDE